MHTLSLLIIHETAPLCRFSLSLPDFKLGMHILLNDKMQNANIKLVNQMADKFQMKRILEIVRSL